MNYTPYNNLYYMQDLQNMRDKIDRQMAQVQQLQQNQNQQPVQQPITQNFQLAPNPSNNDLEAKYADNIEQVKNTFVIKTGIFVNKDFSILWLKNINGEIRTFSLNEIIKKDPKDIEIESLKKELENVKNMLNSQEERIKEDKEFITKTNNKNAKK